MKRHVVADLTLAEARHLMLAARRTAHQLDLRPDDPLHLAADHLERLLEAEAQGWAARLRVRPGEAASTT